MSMGSIGDKGRGREESGLELLSGPVDGDRFDLSFNISFAG